MTFDAGSIRGDLVLDLDRWNRSISQATRDRQLFQTGLTNLGRTGTSVGSTLAGSFIPLTGAFLGLGAAALTVQTAIRAVGEAVRFTLSSAIEFESAFTGVRKTVNATEAEFDSLAASIRGMARQMPLTTSELSEIAQTGGQLGIATENLANFTEVMARFGETADDMTSQEAATQLARWINITGLAQEKIGNLASAITKLGSSTASTEGEITQMGLRLAAIGRRVGFTDGEIAGLAAGLSSVGLNAELAGTAVFMMLSEMERQLGTGGEKVELYAALTGKSMAEFKTAFKEDAMSAVLDLMEAIGDFGQQGGETAILLDKLGLDAARLGDVVGRLSQNVGLFRKSVQTGSMAIQDLNSLMEESERRYATTRSNITEAKNALTSFASAIGEKALPRVNELAEAIKSIATGLDMVARNSAAFDGILQNLPLVGGLFGGRQGRDPNSTLSVDELNAALGGVPAYDPQRDDSSNASIIGGLAMEQARGLSSLLDQVAKTEVEITQEKTAQFSMVESILDSLTKSKEKVKETKAEYEDMRQSFEDIGDALSPIDRGRETFLEIPSVKNISNEINSMMADLDLFIDVTGTAKLSTEEWGLLAEQVFMNLAGLSDEAVSQIVRNLNSPELAEGLNRILSDNADGESAKSRKEGMIGSLFQMGRLLEGLGPRWRKAGQAAMAAARIMQYAGTITKGVWGYVELAIMAVVEALGIMGEKSEKEATGMEAVWEDVGRAIDGWVDALADKFTEFVRNGRADFMEFADMVADEILKIGLTHLVINPAVDFFKPIFGFAKGGVVESFAKGGHVTSGPELFKMRGGQTGLRGEAGPEAILPLERIGGKLGVNAMGGGVIVNVHNQTGGTVDVKQSQHNGQTVLDVVVSAVKSRMIEGDFDNVFTGIKAARGI